VNVFTLNTTPNCNFNRNVSPSLQAVFNANNRSTSLNGAVGHVDISSAVINTTFDPALQPNSLYNNNGDFVAPYAGNYTFTFTNWFIELTGFRHWGSTFGSNLLVDISNGTAPLIYPTPPRVLNLSLVQGQILRITHQSCLSCGGGGLGFTNTTFGDLQFNLSL
jgi:hypothetical protein